MTSISRLKAFQGSLPSGVNLLAVSKGHPASEIRYLVAHGHHEFGESKLQEALPKINDLRDLKEVKWHFIGRIQANKVRLIVREFDVIHSVDSKKLAERISRIAKEENKKPLLFAQVKFRPDPSKTGFLENELLGAWENLSSLPSVKFVGVMTITPIAMDLNERKVVFRECRALANKLGLQDCSMGMSQDWQEALATGSTWLRIGSALFGDRHKQFN